MNDVARQSGLAYFVVMLVLLLSAVAGFWDVLWHGDGLAPQFAFGTVLLWLALCLPIAGLAGLVALAAERGFARHSSANLLTTVALALTGQIAILAAAQTEFIGSELALTLAGTGVLALLMAARSDSDLRPIGGSVSLAILAILCLAASAPPLRGVVPRTVLALIMLGGVSTLLALVSPSRLVRRVGDLGLVALIAVGAVLAVTDAQSADGSIRPAPPSTRPHVVLIVLDTQRADSLGAYGHAGGLTPNLDALASSGTVFESCFTTANWTVPSHASLFTGLYPQTHGASFEHHRYLDDDFETIAESLAASGYATAAFVANNYIRLANMDQGFEHYEEIGAAFKRLEIRDTLESIGLPSRYIDHGAQDGVDRVARHLRERNPSDARPLFLFVNLLEPHWRHFPPLADRLEVLGLADTVTATRHSRGFYGPTAMALNVTNAELLRSVRGLYAAAVQYQDRQFARLLEVLDAALPQDNTLLLVTNDHGENLGEAARWGHSFAINDHLVRAPLIVRHPAFAPGSRAAGLCSLVDVPATIADVVGGLEIDDADDARTLVPSRFVPREHVFAAGDPYLGHFERIGVAVGFDLDAARWNVTLRSARDRRFKFLESSTGSEVLYDIQADPDETADVSAQHPQKRDELRQALRDWEQGLPRYTRREAAPSRILGAEAAAHLKSLGYAN